MAIIHPLKYTVLFLFVVPLIVSRCNSLSFAATRCHSLYHSLSLDVPLVCLFISDRCEGLPKTDRIISFLAKPRERTNYILHNHKLPNSCYEFQFSGVPPTKCFHILSSLTHSNRIYVSIPPANVTKPGDFLQTV